MYMVCNGRRCGRARGCGVGVCLLVDGPSRGKKTSESGFGIGGMGVTNARRLGGRNLVRPPVIRGGAAGEESGPIWDRSTLDSGPHDMRRATG